MVAKDAKVKHFNYTTLTAMVAKDAKVKHFKARRGLLSPRRSALKGRPLRIFPPLCPFKLRAHCILICFAFANTTPPLPHRCPTPPSPSVAPPFAFLRDLCGPRRVVPLRRPGPPFAYLAVSFPTPRRPFLIGPPHPQAPPLPHPFASFAYFAVHAVSFHSADPNPPFAY